MAEGFMALVWRTRDPIRSGGSNPSSTANYFFIKICTVRKKVVYLNC